MATILVVEDREVDRQYLATLLGYYGHRVIQASDGAQALEEAVRERPDLVISDVLMPTIDGYEFVRRLRGIPSVAQTPVMFYTATYHLREVLSLGRQCGVTDVLAKPSEPQAIMTKIDAILGRTSVVIIPPPAASFDREHVRVVSDRLVAKVAELEASQHRVAAVVALCHRFTSQRDPTAVLRDVCAAARDVTLAQHAVVGLVTDDLAGVVQVLTSGLEASAIGDIDNAALRGPLFEPILKDRATVRRRNPDGRPEPLGLPSLSANPAVYSYLGVPIASPTKVYGWLGMRNKLGADEFSEEDEQAAILIGTHAGIAYENARLVDELRRHATALRKNQERTNYALGAAGMGTWQIEVATQRATWSETMPPLFGLTAEQEVPDDLDAIFLLIHADDRRMVEDALAEATAHGTELEVEFRVPWPDHSTHWLAVRGHMPREEAGRRPSMVGIAADISERKSVEAQLRQAQKMDAIGQLAGGVAHDFNNLLTAILGYAHFVLDTLGPHDGRRADMEQVIHAGQRAAGLTRQLLAFSRKQVLHPTAVDINALVRGMLEMLSRLIGAQVDLVPILASDLGHVRGDHGQLEQVLLNLVVNGRDAMPSGGRLAIETANVELDQSFKLDAVIRPGPYVMLAVSDSGTGMTEATKQRLFEPFFTTKELGKGTGLGLATVYGIVKQTGGHVWVYSEPGKGATFKVYLPRADADGAVEKSLPRDQPLAAGTETVLVVEDEEAVRQLTRTILERAGYRVVDAPGPQQAEALFEQDVNRFHLLVTDVIMPGSSGPALFERLLRHHPNLRVLYMSGNTDDTMVHQSHLKSGIEFLQKPFTADALNRRVREVLDR